MLVNRLPAPNSPQPGRVAGGGAFAAGRDVYLEMTYVNAQGESVASAPGILVNTNLHDAARFTVPALSSLAGWIRGLAGAYQPVSVNVYEADVATGEAAPSSASFAQVGNFALGSTVTVTATAPGLRRPRRIPLGLLPVDCSPRRRLTVERASGSGSFPAGRDVYVIATFTNASGETLPSVAGTLIDTILDDAVQVPIPSTLYQITGVNLYEADVATGSAAPATSSYAFVGSFQPLTTATITASASGPAPPVANSSGAAGNIAPDSGTGLRYASIAFTNRNGNLEPHGSGFHFHQRGCARRSTVHGQYSHRTGEHHQPHHRIHRCGRHECGPVLLYPLGDRKRRDPDDGDGDRRQPHHAQHSSISPTSFLRGRLRPT